MVAVTLFVTFVFSIKICGVFALADGEPSGRLYQSIESLLKSAAKVQIKDVTIAVFILKIEKISLMILDGADLGTAG